MIPDNEDAQLAETLNVEAISDEQLNNVPDAEQLQSQEPAAPKEEPKPVESPLEKRNADNIRELRRRAEAAAKAEQERDALALRLAELERRALMNQPAAAAQPEEDIRIGAEEIAEGKHIDAVLKKLHKMEQKVEEYQRQNIELSITARLKSELPDLDKVVTKENMETLSAQYPELAATIKNSPDLYSKAVSAYTLIHKFGIHQDDNMLREKAKIMTNAKKPVPSTAAIKTQPESALQYADGFRMEDITPEMKERLQKEMADALAKSF